MEQLLENTVRNSSKNIEKQQKFSIYYRNNNGFNIFTYTFNILTVGEIVPSLKIVTTSVFCWNHYNFSLRLFSIWDVKEWNEKNGIYHNLRISNYLSYFHLK
jgi:hypothetical protein